MTDLLTLLREDWRTHDRSWSSPGLHALAVQRLGAWRRRQRGAARHVTGVAYWILKTFVRNLYGTELYDTTTIGRRLKIEHHVGVILGSEATIGDDVVIRQNVTLGRAGSAEDDQPYIGDGVRIGAGAIVAGGVKIGDHARIEPGAIVLSDVPAGATALAPKVRIMKAP